MGFLQSAAEEFTKSPIEVLGASAAILAIISTALPDVRKFWIRVWAAIRAKPFVPTETLRIVQNIDESWWSVGSNAGVPNMQVNFQGYVTDISGRPNNVLRLDLPKPLTHTLPPFLVLSRNQVISHAEQTLAPYEHAALNVHFFAQPVVGEPGKPWAVTLIFIDRYNNRHKVKNCVFRGLQPVPHPTPVANR